MDNVSFGSYGFGISIYVIGIMIAISGIVLGLGYATNNRKFKEFGRDEINQSIINGALIGGMLLLFSSNGIVSDLITSATISNGTSLQCQSFMSQNPAICLSYDYLIGPGYTFLGQYHSSLLTLSSEMTLALLGLNALLGFISSITLNLVVLTVSFSSILTPFLFEIQYVVKFLTAISIGAVVQASILEVVSVTALTVLLPIGLILRSFYPTRKVGGFLIALSIGLYVVLPLSYVMNAMIVNSYSMSVNQTSINQVTVNAANIKSDMLNPGNRNFDYKHFDDITGFAAKIAGEIDSLSNMFTNMMNGLFSTLAMFIVYTFVLPSFSLIITGISVRELSMLLGSEAFFGAFDIL